MSCYQSLALNNATGDLSITQGNKVNLVQAIKNFSVKTPVVDFKIVGNTLELYYTDEAGTLQLKTIVLPAAGNNNSAISVASTQSISASITAGVITSNVRISAFTNNALTVRADGLYVPIPPVSITTQDSSSVTLSFAGNTLSASSIISPDAGNSLTINNNGLFVPPSNQSAAQIRTYFSATTPLQYNQATGVSSIPVSTATVDGYIAAVDWIRFNGKVAGAMTVSSLSSVPVFKQENAGLNLEFRGITSGSTPLTVSLSGDDIVLRWLPTVPTVNAGADKSIANPTSSVTMTGSATVSYGTVSATEWSFLSGPVIPVITNASNLSSTVTGLSATGTYAFRLTAVASTGLVATSNVNVVVTGSVVADTIYVGAQGSGIAPDSATIVSTGVTSSQNGSLDVTANWVALSAGGPVYCWIAIPNNGGAYTKTKWFVDPLNHGNIGSPTDLFGASTLVTIGGNPYYVLITNYATQFVANCFMQA